MATKVKNEESVQVVVRVRPLSETETAGGYRSCLECDNENDNITITNVDNESAIAIPFTFDAVYDTDSLQQTVYDEVAFPLVESTLNGYNCTIFAYGQTGCGKTHTMMGDPSSAEERGIVPNCFAHIFGLIDENRQEGAETKYLVRCSYLEIYKEDVFDLLTEKKRGQDAQRLDVREDTNKGFYVKDLKWIMVNSVTELEKAMNYGNNNRKTASTKMNARSSRSHSIFQIYIETAQQKDGQQLIKAGKLNLVDLAGSERSSKTGATGETLKEGILINKSLMTLGNVITALCESKKKHIPYRDSNLTRLLQDSLGGNTKTVMIAALSPANYNYEETMSTLRYANRAKQIKNKPKVNEDPKDALLKQYEDEIKQLKEVLSQFQSGSGAPNSLDMVKELQALRKKQEEHDQEMEAMTKAQITTLEVPSASKEEDNESDQQASARKASAIEEFSVQELIAQLQKQGKRVKLVDQEELAQQMSQPTVGALTEEESPKKLGEQMVESQPSLIQDQARTGTFGGAQLDGTIKEGYQLNAFETPEEAALRNSINNAQQQPKQEKPLVQKKESAKVNEEFDPDFDGQREPPQVDVTDGEAGTDDIIRQVSGEDQIARQISNELDEQAQKHIQNFIAQMENKIVGGAGVGGLSSSVALDGAEPNGPAAAAQPSDGAAAAMSFKAKRERHKQLKTKKRLKHEEKEKLQQQEEQMLLAEDDTENHQEADDGDQKAEIERLRNINKKLRRKYQEVSQEIKDLNKENDTNKTELLDIIRMQEKDIKFNEKVVQIMLTENDQYKLRERSTWDEDTRDWTVPLFLLHKMQDEVAFPTIGAKARVEQVREEREMTFPGESGGAGSQHSRSRSKYRPRDNYSEQEAGAGEDLHDPDMQWNKFSGKANPSSMTKNHNMSGMSSNGDQSAMRRTMINDKIDGVHERRNKYLNTGGEGSVEIGVSNNGSSAVEPQPKKPYSKHLMPISPGGSSVGRHLSTGPSAAAPSDSVTGHPIHNALSPAGARGGIKALGSIDHNKHKMRLQGLQNSNKPVERFRNLEPLSKFQ